MLTHSIEEAGATYIPLEMRRQDPHDQLEQNMGDEKIVLHFSLPKQSRWPDLKRFQEQLEQKGYVVQPVGIMRDWHANISSMLAANFIGDRDEGERKIRKAWNYIFSIFPDNILVVTYEAFSNYAEVRKRILMEDLGLPHNPEQLKTNDVKKEFSNQNEKWYDDAQA